MRFHMSARGPSPDPSGLNIAAPQAVAQSTWSSMQQLQSGPDTRQDVQRHDYLPVWKRLPTMSRHEVQRMMLQNVGLAGHIVTFGAIWHAIADHGGYANVSLARFLQVCSCSSILRIAFDTS
jgi:hypothetical protein